MDGEMESEDGREESGRGCEGQRKVEGGGGRCTESDWSERLQKHFCIASIFLLLSSSLPATVTLVSSHVPLEGGHTWHVVTPSTWSYWHVIIPEVFLQYCEACG